MNTLEFISNLISAFAWPITVLIILVLLRHPLKRLVPLLERLKYKDFEISFREQLEAVRNSVESEGEKLSASGDLNKIIEIAKISPRAAIQETWKELELLAEKKLSAIDQKKTIKSKKALQYFEYSKVFPHYVAETIRELRQLRNQAIHAAEFSLTTDDAIEYAVISNSIKEHIDSITTTPEVRLSALTYLILSYNQLLDTGKYNNITIADIHREIKNKNVLEYIEKIAPDEVDFSLIINSDSNPHFVDFYNEKLLNIYKGYPGNESRKWGVENNGICLLLAWTNEIIQQGAGWFPDKN